MEIRFDFTPLNRLRNILASAGDQAPVALARALNHTAKKGRTQMVRAVVKQTGLKYGTIRRALKMEMASAGSLTAAVHSKGGDIALKYFSPKEGGGGVRAKPRNQGTFVKGAFMTSTVKGGGRAMVRKLNGHVYTNVSGGRWGGAIRRAKSGVFISDEMVEGESREAFYAVASRDLENRIAHEIYRILG